MYSQRDLLELHKLHLSFQDHMIILSKQKEEMERPHDNFIKTKRRNGKDRSKR